LKKHIKISCYYLFLILFACNKVETQEIKISIENHKFIPDKIYVPTDKKIKLIIENLDDTVEEFESIDLKREKIVAGKSTIIVSVGPLKEGTYSFFGEFNADTAQGNIIAKDNH
jgi:hypothetical protein